MCGVLMGRNVRIIGEDETCIVFVSHKNFMTVSN